MEHYMSEKEYTPILPYDITFGENFPLYLNTKYKRDITICGEGTVRMESGNLYKYYRCESVKPVAVGGDK